MFEHMGRQIAQMLHKDTVRLTRVPQIPDGMGGFEPGKTEDLGELACSLQSFSAELAQQEYGLTCPAEKRLYCLPDERVQPGIYADGWRIAAVPVRGKSYIAAVLEGGFADGNRGADRSGSAG